MSARDPRRSRLARGLVSLAAIGVAGLVLGFVLFAGEATRATTTPPPRADAIVVLTGGEHRITEAARLLQQGRGRRLLISGVNPAISKDDVRRLIHLDGAVLDCCVDLGYRALDTVGNAAEARAWSEQWGFKSLIVVTHSYHMPRSLAELSRSMPGMRLVPYRVAPRTFREPWWLSAPTLRVLLAEYVKFLPSAALLAAVRLVRPQTAAAVSSAVGDRLATPAG